MPTAAIGLLYVGAGGVFCGIETVEQNDMSGHMQFTLTPSICIIVVNSRTSLGGIELGTCNNGGMNIFQCRGAS